MILSQALGLRTRKHRSGFCDCSLPKGHRYAKTKDAGFVGIGCWQLAFFLYHAIYMYIIIYIYIMMHFAAVGENNALTLL